VTSITTTAGFACSRPGTLSAYAISHNCTLIAPGGSCAANVTFTPSAAGNVSETLTVASSDGSLTVPLTGTGERSLATHYYRSILRRDPDTAGKAFWEAEADRVASLGAAASETWYSMALQFYGSPDTPHSIRDDLGFLTDLYTTFFNRAPDASGLAYWSGEMSRGMPREVVLASFMFSPEFAAFTERIFGKTVRGRRPTW
jgi:hypothetical protein